MPRLFPLSPPSNFHVLRTGFLGGFHNSRPCGAHVRAVKLQASHGAHSLMTLYGSAPLLRRTSREMLCGNSKSMCTATQGSEESGGKKKESNTTRILGRLFFAGCGALTLYLGTWQLQRYQWKVDLIAKRQQSLQGSFEPAPTGTSFAEWESAHYKRIQLAGTYLHDYAMYVGPRSAPSGGAAAYGGGLVSSPNRETGFYLVTPFKVSSTGQVLLLNRGWVPRRMQNRLPAEVLPKGEIQIIVAPRPLEKPGTLVAQNDPSSGNWFFIDPEEMGSALGMPYTPPFCEVFEEAGKPVSAYPKNLCAGDLINFHVMPITHLAYSATWYGLTAAIAVGTFYRFR